MSSQSSSNLITQDQAREIARKVVADFSDQHDFVLMDELTEERPFGWVFHYTTRKYLETGDIAYIVFGTGPFIVDRTDGSTELLGSRSPPSLKRYLENYERRWRDRQSAEGEADDEGGSGEHG